MDASDYRRVIGHFATGVAVITTANNGWLHGMTANAVASVSLEPLLLLVCVSRDAACHGELLKSGRFGVNILSADQHELSLRFAAKQEPERDALRGVSFILGPHGTPLLEGCLAWLECRVHEQVAAGDHDIFLGAVLGGEVRSDAPPLLYYRGGYRQLAD